MVKISGMEFRILNDFEKYAEKFPNDFNENIYISLCEALKLIHAIDDKIVRYEMLYKILETLCKGFRKMYDIEKMYLMCQVTLIP